MDNDKASIKLYKMMKEKSVPPLNELAFLVSMVHKQISVNDDKDTLLHVCMHYSNLIFAELLVEKRGFDCNAKNKFGWTPLHIACMYNDTDLILFLLELENIKVNDQTNELYTPIQLLMRKGADINIARIYTHKGFWKGIKNKNGEDEYDFAKKYHRMDFDPCFKEIIKSKAVDDM